MKDNSQNFYTSSCTASLGKTAGSLMINYPIVQDEVIRSDIYHTFVEIDHEIISTVILLPSADSFKKGCCQLQAKVCARITG